MWEQAWTTLMEQRFTVLNVILIYLTQVVIMVLTLNEVLKRRHSMNWIISYCMIKVLIMDVFFNILLNTYLEQHFELNIIVIFFKMAVAILNLTDLILLVSLMNHRGTLPRYGTYTHSFFCPFCKTV